jgi:DUF971 family protein
MYPTPTKLERTADRGLAITWSDSQRRAYSVRQLRDACPCATCREKRSQPPEPKGMLTVLSLSETQPLAITKMEPVGNYAYSIEFSDGHGTGIYTLDLLRQLGAESN